MSRDSGTLSSSIGRHLLAMIAFWVVGSAFVQIGERLLGGWPASEVGQLAACVLGVALSIQLRAPLAAYVLAGFAAFSASELASHLHYGIDAVQGAPTHFAVMGAGILGAAAGGVLTRRGQRLAPRSL